MAATNLIILSSTQGELNVTGDAVLGTSYTQAIGSLYTVGIYASNLTGRVYVEGTLVPFPTENDWFPITLSNLNTPYVEFPYTGDSSTTNDHFQLVAFSFKGNFTWVRARLNRDYLALGSPTDQQIAGLGFVDKVVLSIGGAVGIIGDVPSSDGLQSAQGVNIGGGAHIYASVTGETNALLSFKTLIEGAGIQITETDSTVMIEATGVNGVVDVSSLAVQANGSNVVAHANTINFTGNAVSVSNVAGIPTVAISHLPSSAATNVEYVVFQYTAGSTGTLNSQDALLASSSGVTVNITDTNNCIIEFTFAGYIMPPVAIAVLGQVVSTNDFIFSNVNPSFGTRKVRSGGTSSSPTILSAFTGPITLQLRMNDTGASAGIGQRAQAIVMFKF